MYDVINEVEIKLKAKDGTAMTYRKCTSDTHPVLQYPTQMSNISFKADGFAAA